LKGLSYEYSNVFVLQTRVEKNDNYAKKLSVYEERLKKYILFGVQRDYYLPLKASFKGFKMSYLMLKSFEENVVPLRGLPPGCTCLQRLTSK